MENINIPTKITIMEKSAEINLDKKKKQKSKTNEGKYITYTIKVKPEDNIREDIMLLKRLTGTTNVDLFSGLIKIALVSLESYLAPYRKDNVCELQKFFK